MTDYKPIFNHAAIQAAKAQAKKDKTITALLAIGTTALFIARPFILNLV
jgi:hypothetical protein